MRGIRESQSGGDGDSGHLEDARMMRTAAPVVVFRRDSSENLATTARGHENNAISMPDIDGHVAVPCIPENRLVPVDLSSIAQP
jgi:hypothetical protein